MNYEHGKLYVYDATSQTFDLAAAPAVGGETTLRKLLKEARQYVSDAGCDEDGTMQAELSIIVHHDFFKFILMTGFAVWIWMCVIAGRAET